VLASDPKTPERLFAGTTWAHSAGTSRQRAGRICPRRCKMCGPSRVDPANPDIVIAGTRPAGFLALDRCRRTWSRLAAPGISQFSDVNVGPTRVTQILFDPHDDGTVWASVEIGSVYRSKDRGLTWERKDNGLVSGDVHGPCVMKLTTRRQSRIRHDQSRPASQRRRR